MKSRREGQIHYPSEVQLGELNTKTREWEQED